MPRARRRTVRHYFAVGMLCLAVVAGSSAAEERSLEYQIKAAFLLNFTKFVEWPAPAAPNPNAPISICLFGSDPFGPALDQMAQAAARNGPRILIQRVVAEPIPACHVLFVPSQSPQPPALLEGLDPNVLTVGEGEEFLRQGGMIAFVIQDRRVRFDVNQRATSKSGITLSARLLKVARSVEK